MGGDSAPMRGPADCLRGRTGIMIHIAGICVVVHVGCAHIYIVCVRGPWSFSVVFRRYSGVLRGFGVILHHFE